MSAPLVVLLCGSADPLAAGSMLAAGLRAACREPHAVVAVLRDEAAPPPAAAAGMPALAGARRVRSSLVARGIAADATGRLVHAWPGGDARAQVGRVMAAADGPVVVAIPGTREAAHEAVIDLADSVVAAVPAAAPASLAEVMRGAGVAHVVAVDVRGAPRRMARSGVVLDGPLRALGAQLGGAGT